MANFYRHDLEWDSNQEAMLVRCARLLIDLQFNLRLGMISSYRLHTEYDGKVMFSVCLSTGGPGPVPSPVAGLVLRSGGAGQGWAGAGASCGHA